MTHAPEGGDTGARVAAVIVGVQGLRAFLYGFGAVLLGTILSAEGLSPLEAGAVFTLMLLGMAVGSLAVTRIAYRWDMRVTYSALFLVLSVAGAAFALTSWLPLLAIAALTGTVSTDANESGPITTVEQSLLSGVDARVRVRVFGRYNAVAYLGGSLGSLAAGLPAIVTHGGGVQTEQHWLLAFPVIGCACAVLALRLPRHPRTPGAPAVRRRLQRSRGRVRQLAGLFAVDAFAGGLVVQSFIVFWFERRFGATAALMGATFFAVGLLQALSSIAAPLIAHRVGLLATMVFTHLPSNLLLAAVGFMPSLPLAIGALLLRSLLSQMDVPTRQAYLAALVDPDERMPAAAYTNSARYAARPLGPVVAGTLMQGAALSLPFAIAGGVKSIYDIVLFAGFRHVPIEEPRGLQA